MDYDTVDIKRLIDTHWEENLTILIEWFDKCYPGESTGREIQDDLGFLVRMFPFIREKFSV